MALTVDDMKNNILTVEAKFAIIETYHVNVYD